MSEPRRVSRRQLRDDPHIAWNEYVSLLAHADLGELTEPQRAAFLVFWYEQEVQNGGHLQYFENRGTAESSETISALVQLGATHQAKVLSRAAARYSGKARPKLESVDEYVDVALKGEFDDLDQNFHACQPSLVEVLENYLAGNQREFVLIE